MSPKQNEELGQEPVLDPESRPPGDLQTQGSPVLDRGLLPHSKRDVGPWFGRHREIVDPVFRPFLEGSATRMPSVLTIVPIDAGRPTWPGTALRVPIPTSPCHRRGIGR
ncbi:MAG: hypothetical protein ACKPGI_17235, partial [Verrucomicrobiota bacterium]